jgi:hypothetical protein
VLIVSLLEEHIHHLSVKHRQCLDVLNLVDIHAREVRMFSYTLSLIPWNVLHASGFANPGTIFSTLAYADRASFVTVVVAG